MDFQELNPTSPVHMLVDTLNSKKTLPLDTLHISLRNLGEYLQCVPMDAGIGISTWSLVIQGIETLFRRLILALHNLEEHDYLLDIMVSVIKIPGISKVCYMYINSQTYEETNYLHSILPGSAGTFLKGLQLLHPEYNTQT